MKKTFEEALTELEEIIGKIEVGDMPLEESLELFEQGVKLSRDCRARLTNAERRIEILSQDQDGNLSAAEFEPSSLREE